MDFRFDPQRTRDAFANLALRFPKQRQQPLALDALFRCLEQMEPSALENLSRKLLARDLDLLCRNFNKAPSPRALMAACLVLGFRGDQRFGEVIRYFLFQLPRGELLQSLRAPWRSRQFSRLLLPGLAWIGHFFDGDEPELVGFIIAGVKAGQVPLASILVGADLNEPLAGALIDFIFAEGHEWIARIPSEQARIISAQFLVDRRDSALQAFFNHYPERAWPTAFLELVYNAKGAPDPETRPFYRAFEKGRLWVFRQKLFRARMEQAGDLNDWDPFWQRWLHRFQDWKRVDGVSYIHARPLKIKDTTTASEMTLTTNPSAAVDRLEKDPGWEAKMDALLQQNLGW